MKLLVRGIVSLVLVWIWMYGFGFGKNKINYRINEWYVYELGNYRLFLDVSQTNISKFIIRALKDNDEELRTLTLRDLNEVFPVIIFPNQIDFRGNNIIDEFIDESVGGFTEGVKNRLVMPMSGNWGFFKRVLKHEMVHVYQFDALKSPQYRKILRNVDIKIPLWFIEGMAEYYSVGWDFSSEEVLRDITINNSIVPLSRLSDLNKLSSKEYYLIYRQGHAFLKYVGDKFGKPTIYRIFKAYLSGSKDPFKSELGIEINELEKSFVYDVRKRYMSMLSSWDEVNSFAKSITDEPYGEESYSKFIPTFVTTNLIAFLSYHEVYPKIVLFDINEKKIVRSLVIGGFDENYLEFHITRNNISCSTNGIMVFVSRSGGRDVINVYTVSNGNVYQVSFDNIRIISSPDISLDGEVVVFAGFDGNREDIYVYNLVKKSLVRVTDDIFYDGEPRISPDKRYVYFVSSRNKSSIYVSDTDIYVFDLISGSLRKLVDIGGEEQNPFITADGKFLFFVSTIDGVRNIFVYSFEDGKVRRFSRVLSGAFSPKLNVFSTKIIFSSIDNLTYNLYQKDFDVNSLQEIVSNNSDISVNDISNFNFEISRIEGIEVRNVSKYSIIPTVDYLTGALSLSSDLGFMVIFGASFSDLLGDHRLSVLFNNAYIGNAGYMSFSEMNYLISYCNYKFYFDFGFQVYNVRDYLFSLLNYFYLPSVFYEVDERYYSKSGVSGFISYPFSTFSRVDLFFERTEYYYFSSFDYETGMLKLSRGYSVNDISLSYSYDSTLWSVVGPINGIRSRVKISYHPSIFEGDKTFFSIIGDFRWYLMLSLIDNLAFRVVAGCRFGQDVESFKFRIGGLGTIRGYEFREFAGNIFLLSNFEFRLALIRALLGPFGFSFPPIFASLFVDAGIIGDDISVWRLTYYDPEEGAFKLKDLKMGVGIGVGVLLGVGFKLRFDFASPFDGRRLVDYQNWKTYFQIGYEF